MVWEPSSCCGCCKPRVGTLVLGWLGVVGSALGILGAIRSSFMPQEELQVCPMGQRERMDFEGCTRISGSAFIISGVEEAVRGLISVLLLVGVNKGNQCLMLPYMIFQVIGIVVVGLGSLALVIFLAVFHLWLGSFITLLVGAGATFLLTYFFLVVRICYKEIKQQNLTKDSEIEVGYMSNQEPPPPYNYSNKM